MSSNTPGAGFDFQNGLDRPVNKDVISDFKKRARSPLGHIKMKLFVPMEERNREGEHTLTPHA